MVNFLVNHAMVALVLVHLFVLGAIAGSFLNVWIARLSYDKSVLWPLGSRCGTCWQAVRWYDNIPLVSYWLLGGRCRKCRTPFSIRYFFVELTVAVGFPLIFYLEVIRNIHGFPAFNGAAFNLQANLFGAQNLPYLWLFLHRAVLFCFLVAAAGCDLETRTIPLSLTLIGAALGLGFAVLLPWPWPNLPAGAMPRPPEGVVEWWLLAPNEMQKLGMYPWPVWGPLPSWLPAGGWRLGLATGVAGALVGTFLLRAVKFLFEKGLGREALGLGDADMMMMVGAFLGWQVVVVSFLLGGVVSLFIALPRFMMKGDNELPLGPGLAAGTVLTWLGWSVLGPNLQVMLFNPQLLGVFVLGCGAVILLLSFVFGLLRGRAPQSLSGK